MHFRSFASEVHPKIFLAFFPVCEMNIAIGEEHEVPDLLE